MRVMKKTLLSGSAALLLLCAGLAHASSLVSISESLVGTLTSISDSSTRASRSSTNAVADADGNYKVIDVARADQAGKVRLTLQALDGQKERSLELTMPRAQFDHAGIAAGTVVTAMPRPYGVAFARVADNRDPFVVVLAEGWTNELAAHPVAG